MNLTRFVLLAGLTYIVCHDFMYSRSSITHFIPDFHMFSFIVLGFVVIGNK